jgi:hypothetical protein
MSTAARVAASATQTTMRQYRSGFIHDEDDITPYLLATIGTTLDGEIAGLTWRASVARHRRGVAAEEARTGADILIHVTLDTPTQTYAKGALVQAKRFGPEEFMSKQEHVHLRNKCDKMLAITPASFVFNYMTDSMRVGAASRIIGSSGRHLRSLCSWTPYRFFFELFRCPIGDGRITSALFPDLTDPARQGRLVALLPPPAIRPEYGERERAEPR